MGKGSDNQFPKVILEEVATDGSATTTPAADHRSLFLGEDGGLHLKDSAAAVTDVGGGGGGSGQGLVALKSIYKTSGNNYTMANANWTDLDAAGLDVVIPASAADVIEYTLTAKWNNDAGAGRLDVATIVAGSPVNYFGNASGTNTGNGVLAWFTNGSAFDAATGSVHRTLVSGDISGGNCTLRLRFRTAASKSFQAGGSTDPIFILVKNLGPVT